MDNPRVYVEIRLVDYETYFTINGWLRFLDKSLVSKYGRMNTGVTKLKIGSSTRELE